MPTRRKISETVALKHAGTELLSASWPCTCLLLCLFVLFFSSSAAAADYLVYLPKPVETIDAPLSGEGVLVKKIMIRPGDTLSAISRRFSGKGSYFPQILLFNNIRNPNRIYAGRKLFVPVSGHRSSKKQSPPPPLFCQPRPRRGPPFANGKESRRITVATARCSLLSGNSLTRRPRFLPKPSIARP
jgi:LysM repeat protein